MTTGIDIATFRFPGRSRSTAPAEALRARSRKFIRGPLSLAWVERAARQPGHALHVAILLLYRSGLLRSRTVKLSGIKAFGLSRWAAQRGLKKLEKAGLVAVERRAGRKPRVTLLGADVSNRAAALRKPTGSRRVPSH